jgi:hypothetical protein
MPAAETDEKLDSAIRTALLKEDDDDEYEDDDIDDDEFHDAQQVVVDPLTVSRNCWIISGVNFVEVTLDRIVDHAGDARCIFRNVQVLADACLQTGSKVVMYLVVHGNSGFQSLDLGTDDGGGKVAHSDRVVGEFDGQALKVLGSRHSDVLGVQRFVGTGNNGSPGGNVGVVGSKNPPSPELIIL